MVRKRQIRGSRVQRFTLSVIGAAAADLGTRQASSTVGSKASSASEAAH